MLRSKLNETKYPCVKYAEIDQYLTFAPGIVKDAIDPVFLGRLAALARDLNKKINITSGFRSIESQKKIFFSRGGKYDAKKGYYWPDSIPASKRTVAKPGSSFHNFALAIDTDTVWLKALDYMSATDKQKTLLKYGLFKPLAKGNNIQPFEDWHIQPIETRDVPRDKRASLQPLAA